MPVQGKPCILARQFMTLEWEMLFRVVSRGALAALVVLAMAPAAIAQPAGAGLPVAFQVTGPIPKRTRVAAPSYGVSYVVAGRARSSATGGSTYTAVDLSVSLEGPTAADMQALADEAHADLLAQLKAAGFEVVAPETAAADPALAAIPRAPGGRGENSGKLDGRANKLWLTFSPAAAPLFQSQNSWPAGDLMLLGKLGKPSKALDATLITPRLILDFTSLNASKNSTWSGKASAGGALEFSIDGLSQVNVTSADPKGLGVFTRLTLRNQIVSPQPLAGDLAKGVGKPAVNIASLFGRASVDVFRADPAAWREQVRAAYRGYNAGIVATLSRGR